MIDYLNTLKTKPKAKRKYIWVYKPSFTLLESITRALANKKLSSEQLATITGYAVTSVLRALNWMFKKSIITKQRSDSDGRVFIYGLGE